jgi:hypothetical protein
MHTRAAAPALGGPRIETTKSPALLERNRSNLSVLLLTGVISLHVNGWKHRIITPSLNILSTRRHRVVCYSTLLYLLHE